MREGEEGKSGKGGDRRNPHPFDEWFDRRNYRLAQKEPTLKAHMREAWNAAIDHSALTIVLVALKQIKRAKKRGPLGTGPE